MNENYKKRTEEQAKVWGWIKLESPFFDTNNYYLVPKNPQKIVGINSGGVEDAWWFTKDNSWECPNEHLKNIYKKAYKKSRIGKLEELGL